MAIEMIAADLDGTILDPVSRVTERTCRVMQAVLDAGITFVPVTGRAYMEIPPEIKALRGLRYAITTNGSRVLDVNTEKPMLGTYLDPDLSGELCRAGAAFAPLVMAYVDGGCLVSLDPKTNPIFQTNHILRPLAHLYTHCPPNEMATRLHASQGLVEKLVFFCEKQEQYPGLCRALEAFSGGVEMASSLGYNMELTAKGINKGVALTALCRQLAICPENLAVLGDGENDIPMLQCTKHAYAMGNASEKTKAVATYIAPSNGADGAAQIMEQLLTCPKAFSCNPAKQKHKQLSIYES